MHLQYKLAHSTVSLVTDAQGLVGGGDHTRALVAAGDLGACIFNASLAHSTVSLVTDAQGLVGGGDHTRAIVTTVDI